MDPYSGRTYATPEHAPADVRDRLVYVEGKPEHVQRLSAAASHYAGATGNRADRRAAAKAARKARRRNR